MSKPSPVLAEPLGARTRPSSSARSPWYQTALTELYSPRGLWWITGLAFLLAAGSFGVGLSTDDHVARANAQQGFVNPLTAFGFRPQPGLDRSSGYLAWWSSPELSVKFLRPLSVLTHADFILWPNAVWAMHGINILLYTVLAGLAWWLYRTLIPGAAIAALATLLFTVDEGHAQAVGWISSRNTVLCAVFGLAAIGLHVRARQRGKTETWKSASCFALALLAGEGGSATFAYLIAYEVAFETGALRERVSRLWAHLSVSVLWLMLYLGGHYGVHGPSFYRELSDPLSVIGNGLADLPLWIAGLLGPSLIGSTLVLPPVSTRLIAAAVCLPVCIVIARTVPPTRENRFFALGALLCLPPLFTTVTQDRLLIMASFGAFGVLSSFIFAAAQAARRMLRVLGWSMLAIHGGLAALLFMPMLSGGTGPIELGSRALVAALPKEATEQVVLVNVPLELLPMYARYIVREQSDRTPPELLQQLYAGASELTLTRVDDSTLEVHAKQGWGASPIERIFGNIRDMPREDEVVQLDRMQLRVLASTSDGRPERVQFRFPSSLESSDRLLYVWQGKAPALWRPPPVGHSEVLPAMTLFDALPQ